MTQLPENPFNTDASYTHIGGESSYNISGTFAMMSDSFFKTADSHLIKLLKKGDLGDYDCLAILHNMIIGVELGLKAAISGFRNANANESYLRFKLETGHGLCDLIKEVESLSEASSFSDNEKEWVKDSLDKLKKLTSYLSEQELDFMSTRYPIDQNSNHYKYGKTRIYLDLGLLRDWLEVIRKAIQDLTVINDYLDANERS